MSGEATGEVWRYSPLVGDQLLVHLAIADVVNDMNGNDFWMSTEKLARKARVSRRTVVRTLGALVDLRLLEVVKAGGATRQPTRYRFLFTSAISALARPALAPSVHPLAPSTTGTSATVAHNTKRTKLNSSATREFSTGIDYEASDHIHSLIEKMRKTP